MKRCAVRLLDADGNQLGQAWTDEEGHFRIRTPADETGPLNLDSTWEAPDGTESSVSLRGVRAGEDGLLIRLGR